MQTTRWTLVGDASDPTSERGLRALEAVVQSYRPALLAHLTNARGLPPPQAEDYVQGFLVQKLWSGKLLASAEQKKGRFRTYLLTALDRYAISQLRRERAQRRAPAQGHLIPLDTQIECTVAQTPHHVTSTFDQEWSRIVIEKTLLQVEHRCRATGRDQYWELFMDRIVGPALYDRKPRSYAEIMGILGFHSPMQAANALVTVRRMFDRTIRQVVREYVPNAKAVEQELQDLLSSLAVA